MDGRSASITRCSAAQSIAPAVPYYTRKTTRRGQGHLTAEQDSETKISGSGVYVVGHCSISLITSVTSSASKSGETSRNEGQKEPNNPKTQHKNKQNEEKRGKHNFFFLGYGRCRTVARFLHEHKRSKTTFVQGPRRSRSAGKSQQNKNHPKQQDDPQIPSQNAIVKAKTANQTHKGARAKQNTHKKDLPRDTVLKNMQN